MVMSALSAPIYLKSLMRRRAAAPQPVRRHAQGRRRQPRPAADLPRPPVLGRAARGVARRLRPSSATPTRPCAPGPSWPWRSPWPRRGVDRHAATAGALRPGTPRRRTRPPSPRRPAPPAPQQPRPLRHHDRRRTRPWPTSSEEDQEDLLGIGGVALLAGLNAPAALGFAQERYHEYKIAQPGYRAEYGSWSALDIPEEFRTNAIHAALLHTGKVLIVAGLGQRAEEVRQGDLRHRPVGPGTDTFKRIATPDDFFCAGHAQLPDGRLLVAGGTARYELLDGEVERAGGGMRVKNENPDKAMRLKKGTRFRSPPGSSTSAGSTSPCPGPGAPRRSPYDAAGVMRPWVTKVVPSEARVFVEAEDEGPRSRHARGRPSTRSSASRARTRPTRTASPRRSPWTSRTSRGSGRRTSSTRRPRGTCPSTRCDKARWYPTLVGTRGRRVLAVSGLDDFGRRRPRATTRSTTRGPGSGRPAPKRYFPTYPALFLTQGGKLFYSASNAGYGPDDLGRDPGLWDLGTNKFQQGARACADPERDRDVRRPCCCRPPRTRR